MKQAEANHVSFARNGIAWPSKLCIAASSVASVDAGGFESGLLLTKLCLILHPPRNPSFFICSFLVVTLLKIRSLRMKMFRLWPQTLSQLHALWVFRCM